MFAVDDDWGDESGTTTKLCEQMFGKVSCNEAGSVRKAKSGKKKKNKLVDKPIKSPITTVSKTSVTKRLEGSRFRWINEQLYSMTSKQASKLFTSQPDLYEAYHTGFRAQLEKWPCDPVENIISYVSSLPEEWVIVDMGCGDANLAASVPHQVHSFDLVASNDRVTVSDMANVPLHSNSVNVTIFCLSLMSTNLSDFIREAHRILVPKGILKITEIRSRIDDIDVFVQSVCSYGFRFIKKNISKIFVDLELQKTKQSPSTQPVEIALKPCLYKRR